MVERDTVRYISDAVKIINHNELGLIMILRGDDVETESIQRALDTTKYRLKDSNIRKTNGCMYYSLEEV